MHAFMFSIFVYPQLVENDNSHNKHNSAFSAYRVFSTMVYMDNIFSIMYVVLQSYSYCGNHNLNF